MKYAISALVAGFAILLGLRWILTSGSVAVARVKRGTAVQAVYATGTVEPSVMVPIAARAGGRLVELNSDEGSKVVKGQVLGRLEDADLINTIAELKAREEFARSDLERNKRLRQNNAIPEQVLEKSKSDWEAAKAALARAVAEADFTKLIAPEDGSVIRRDGEVGEMIAANQPVFWMSCCAPLRISAEVDEEDIALVEPGQKVLIQADAFPGEQMNGTVTAITPKGDAVTRSFRVRIGLESDVPLMIGMTAETNIITRERPDALLIPATAEHEGHVWIISDGRVEKRKVKIGARGFEQLEVLDGLKEGDMVAVDGRRSLSPGSAVSVYLSE